jgi:HAE1 family hydrophobic/amphiphilic exporter-1
VRGIGNAGGFKMMVQDKRGRGLPAARRGGPGPDRARPIETPGLAGVFSLFNTRTPKIYADIDRVKAEMLGVPADRVFETLEVYLGSAYVNDFNYLGRTYRVTAQADGPFRRGLRDIANLKTRNAMGEHGADRLRRRPSGPITGPYRVPRYNLYPGGARSRARGARRSRPAQALAPDGAARGRAPARRLRL